MKTVRLEAIAKPILAQSYYSLFCHEGSAFYFYDLSVHNLANVVDLPVAVVL